MWTRLVISFCAAMLMFSGTAFAAAKVVKESKSQWVAEATATYVMGDNDTRIDARNIALNEAKRAASEIVGSQVKTDLVVENDKILKDQISVITAAFMKVEVIKENMTVTKDKRSEMEITIRATLSKSDIQGGIGSYKGDTERQATMTRLQDENARLQSELDSLNKKLASGKESQSGGFSKKNHTELLARRDAVISELDDSGGNIRAVFKKGTLITMARANTDDYGKAKEAIQRDYFDYVQKHTIVKLTSPKFTLNADGTYNARIGLRWTIDRAPVDRVFSKYFTYSVEHADSFDSSSGLCVEMLGFFNFQDKQKREFTEMLLNNLVKKTIYIRISIGASKVDFPITYFSGNSGISEFKYLWMPSGRVNQSVSGQSNPVVIHDIPAATLQESTTISSEIVVLDNG